MLLINIIHRKTDVIEYLCISSFFKLFGIAVYNSIGENNLLPSQLVVPEDDIIKVAYIVIHDDIEEALNEFGIDLSLKDNCVFVNKGKSSENGIKFPEKYIKRYIEKFFSELIEEMSNLSIFKNLKSDDMELLIQGLENKDDKENIINIYYNCDLLKNYYIPMRALRSQSKAAEYIFKLYNKEKQYSYLIGKVDKPLQAYAAVNLKYMVNRVCESSKFKPLIEWKEIIEDIAFVHKNAINRKRTSFLAAQIFEHSEKDNSLTEMLYKETMYKCDYYTPYRLAKFYEFRFCDRNLATKYLELSEKNNNHYYRAIYKLGVYSDEKGDYEAAFKHYQNVLFILLDAIDKNYFQPLEMEYFIKTCGRIINLNHFLRSETLVRVCKNKVLRLIENIEDNSFILELCDFSKSRSLKDLICSDLRKNAKEHARNFCGIVDC